MAAFLQTVDGDLALTTGRLTLVSGSTQKAQKIRNQLQLVKGSWVLNKLSGVPYFTKVFGKNPSLNGVKQLLRRAILSIPGVETVTNVVTTVDPKTRVLNYTFVAVDDEGTEIPGNSTPFTEGAT